MPELTPPRVAALIRAGKRAMESDGEGLYLRIRDSGSAAWYFRYRFGGKDVWCPLGNAKDMPLATARKNARAQRVLVDQGRSPLAEKRQQREQEAGKSAFKRVALNWYQREIETKYANPKPVWAAIENHILPKLGRKAAQDITATDCERVLEPLRTRAPTMANDALRYMKRIFSYARRRRIVEYSPVAEFNPALDGGGKEAPRSRALSRAELVAFFRAMRTAEALGGTNALAIKLLLALCVRKLELVGAKWEEFNLNTDGPDGAVWHLPTDRTKTAAALDIPLAPAVVTWLSALKTLSAGSAYVFPKRRRDRRARQEHISKDTLNAALARIKHKLAHFTLHDMRRTARTHLAEMGVPQEVGERCLNHKPRGVVGIYNQHDYFAERRKYLELWCARIQEIEVESLKDRG